MRCFRRSGICARCSHAAVSPTIDGSVVAPTAASGHSSGRIEWALASLSDTDSTTGTDKITVNASDSFGNTAAPASIAVTVNSAAAMQPAVALNLGVTRSLSDPGRQVSLSRDAGERKTVAATRDGTDHLAATLQLLNQYAHQFGVSSADHSLASDKALGMPGNDFHFEHGGSAGARHWRSA